MREIKTVSLIGLGCARQTGEVCGMEKVLYASMENGVGI